MSSRSHVSARTHRKDSYIRPLFGTVIRYDVPLSSNVALSLLDSPGYLRLFIAHRGRLRDGVRLRDVAVGRPEALCAARAMSAADAADRKP